MGQPFLAGALNHPTTQASTRKALRLCPSVLQIEIRLQQLAANVARRSRAYPELDAR